MHAKGTEEIPSLRAALLTIRKLGQEGLNLQRYKGLGEMNADQLWDTTMDPATRTLLRVQLEEQFSAEEIFQTLMGNDVEARRTFIQQNAKDVRFLDA